MEAVRGLAGGAGRFRSGRGADHAVNAAGAAEQARAMAGLTGHVVLAGLSATFPAGEFARLPGRTVHSRAVSRPTSPAG